MKKYTEINGVHEACRRDQIVIHVVFCIWEVFKVNLFIAALIQFLCFLIKQSPYL